MSAEKRPSAAEIVQRMAGDNYEPAHEASYWLQSRIDERLHKGRTEGLTSCGHSLSEGPAVLALWGGPAVCVPCTTLLETVVGDLACDRCAAVLGIGAQLCTLAVGELVILFHLCPDCFRREHGEDG